MKATLKAVNRVYFPTILPKEGNFLEMKTIEGIKKKVEFTEAEIKEIGLESSENGITWNPKINIDKEITFEKAEAELLKKELKKLDEERKLTENTATLYELFV